MKIEPWNVSNKNKVLETPIYEVFKINAASSTSDIQGNFYVMDVPDWVNVIAMTPDDEIILVEQYRHGIDNVTLEIPGGVVDPDEMNPLMTAKRELSEETGFTSTKWTSLGKVSANPAIMNNWCHFFLAENCEKTDSLNPDSHEELAVKKLTRKTFLNEVRNGNIHHSLVVAAVARIGLQRLDWLDV